MKKKINPRRRPATQADVNRAKEDATKFAVDATSAIVLFVLREKFGFGHKRLHRFWTYLEDYCTDVVNGVLNVREVMDVLRDEYGITFREE